MCQKKKKKAQSAQIVTHIYISSLGWTKDMLLTWTSLFSHILLWVLTVEQSWAVETGDKTKLPGVGSCVQEYSQVCSRC